MFFHIIQFITGFVKNAFEIDTAPPDTAPSGNAPVFVDPAQGGPNPFVNAPPTKIEDHPVDEFIEEGDDKPAA